MEAFKTAARQKPAAFESVLHALGDSLTCGICSEPMINPHTSNCGHTFCGVCLVKWLEVSSDARRKKNCPICRTEFSGIPVPSLIVKELIASVLKALKLENPEAASAIEEYQSSTQLSDAQLHERFEQLRVGPSRIVDEEDGVQRCPVCHWEIADDEDVCPQCGPGDPEEDEAANLPSDDDLVADSDAESLNRWRAERDEYSEGDDFTENENSGDDAGSYDDPEISITQSTQGSDGSDDEIDDFQRRLAQRRFPSRRGPRPSASFSDEEIEEINPRPTSRRRIDVGTIGSSSSASESESDSDSDSDSDSGSNSNSDGDDGDDAEVVSVRQRSYITIDSD